MLLAPAGHALLIVNVLLVNCLVIPLSEERLWRGLVQPRLIVGLGFASGLALTAALFSRTHALVDASLGRLRGIIGAGLVRGVISARPSWKIPAVAHAVANTRGEALIIALTGGRSV